ncbi:MAG: HD domain-containing protein [Eudoraea sp.]|nr:HD domain-containing protein [Muriicola sp.]NNE02805.1 HD domain-containing protein [Eudoraea sp.]
MKGYNKLRNQALYRLKEELTDDHHYHGLAHTIDVLKVCNAYIKRENIGTLNAKLLRIAALYHDVGFISVYERHEDESARIAKKDMENLGMDKHSVKVVLNLIMATKTPQAPQTILEKIICDADLDYLGREDYYEISNKLYQELKAFKLVSNKEEWIQQQISFLKAHTYHTQFARKNRQPEKERRIKELCSQPN